MKAIVRKRDFDRLVKTPSGQKYLQAEVERRVLAAMEPIVTYLPEYDAAPIAECCRDTLRRLYEVVRGY